MSAVIYATLAVLVGIALAVIFPDMTQAILEAIAKARRITSAVFFALFAFVFIASGVEILVVIGVLMLVYAAGWLWVNRDTAAEAI